MLLLRYVAQAGWRVLLCLMAGLCRADVYRYTDAQGQVHYTNQPPTGVASQRLNIQSQSPSAAKNHSNQTAIPPLNPYFPSQDSAKTTAYQQIQIQGLNAEEAMRANNGQISVSLNLVPPLQAGHQIRWILDGQMLGAPSTQPQLSLSDLDRGAHNLQAEILNNQNVVQRSAPIAFSIQRTHK